MTLISNSLPPSWNTAVQIFMRPPSCLLGSSCTADPSPGGECGSAWAVTPCCILPLSSSSTTAASLCPSVSTLYLHAPANWLCIYLPGSQPRREEKAERRVPLTPQLCVPCGQAEEVRTLEANGSAQLILGPERVRGPGRAGVRWPPPTAPACLPLGPRWPLPPRPFPVGRLMQEARPRAPQHPRSPAPVPAPLRSQRRRSRRRRRQRNKGTSVCGGGGQLLPPARSRPSSMAAAPRGQRAAR